MKNKLFNKAISFILIVFMMVSILPVNLALAAVGDSETTPIVFNQNDIINFPQYPNEGYVRVDKKAEWVENEDDVAQITMTIDGKGVQKTTDVVLVIDRSGSMDDEISISKFNEVNLSFTASNINYQYEDWVGIWIFGDYEWRNDVASDVTISMIAFLDDNGKYVGHKSGSLSVSGFKTSDRNYRLNSNSGSFGSWTTLSDNNCVNALLNIFRGKTSRVESNDKVINVTFPTEGNILINTSSTTIRKIKKIEEAKVAANKFVDALLSTDSNQSLNRVAVVSYSSSGYGNGEVFVDSNLSNNKISLKSSINKIKAVGGTHIQAGLKEAQRILTGSNADNKYIVVLSDGEPTFSYKATSAEQTISADFSLNYPTSEGFKLTSFSSNTLGSGAHYEYYKSGWNGFNYKYSLNNNKFNILNNGTPTLSQALMAKKEGIEIYSVGFDVSNNSDAKYVMEHIASRKDNYYLTNDDLSNVFANIAGRFAKAGTSAKISTTVNINNDKGYNFTILDDSKHPVTTTLGTATVAGNTISWNLGDITETKATLTYFIKLNVTGKNTIPDNTMLDIGDLSTITYKNYNGKWVSQDFPKIILAAGDGTINVSYYLSDEEGNPINNNKEVIPFENRVKIEGSNIIESALIGQNITVESYIKVLDGYLNHSVTAYDENGVKAEPIIPVTRKTIYLNFPYYKKLIENKLINNSMYTNKGLSAINSGNSNFSVVAGFNYTFGFSFESNEEAPEFNLLVKGNENSSYTLSNFKLYEGNKLVSEAQNISGLNLDKIQAEKTYSITYGVSCNKVGESISIEVENENLMVNEGVSKTIALTSHPMPTLE